MAQRFRPAALALCLSSLAYAWSAAAHTGGTTGFATVTVQGRTVRYELNLGLDAVAATGVDPGAATTRDYDALAGLVARRVAIVADGRACAAVPGTVTPPPPGRAQVVIVVDYACAAPVRALAVRDDLFDALGRDHHTLAIVEWPGGREQVLFQPDRREALVTVAGETVSHLPDRPARSGPFGFFVLGMEHILLGFDHILFLLALILRGGRIGPLLGIVTAFTVAHSITLALSVLDVMTAPAWLVEPLIALSIVYVAVENIFLEQAPSRRWAVGFLFGLVHGFGFAGALRELGLPTGALARSLLSFNLGVEAGQAIIVAALLPALLWLRRFEWERPAVTAMSAIVLVAGLALLVGRTLFPEG